MYTEGVQEINKIPKTYGDWIDCFYILCHKKVSKRELEFLHKGECIAFDEMSEFFEKNLIQTINTMIKRSIKIFNKELELYLMYNEYDNIHHLFIELANSFKVTLFFRNFDFLSQNFRLELQNSIIEETTKFWNLVIKNMYKQCVENNNLCLEDELYMIKRIKLFD